MFEPSSAEVRRRSLPMEKVNISNVIFQDITVAMYNTTVFANCSNEYQIYQVTPEAVPLSVGLLRIASMQSEKVIYQNHVAF